MPGIRQPAGTNGLLTVFPKKTCGYTVAVYPVPYFEELMPLYRRVVFRSMEQTTTEQMSLQLILK